MKKTVFSIVAAATAFGAAGASAQMQDPIVNPRGMVANFDAANLGTVLTELGVVWQERQLADGQRFIAASAGGNLSFNIVPAACLGPNNTGCVGAQMFAMFTGKPATAQSLAAFNASYAFTSVGALPDSSAVYISRYDIADYGIPRGNVASSVFSFFALAERFQQEVIGGTTTVSADGYAEDMSAAYLNRAAGEKAGVVSAAASNFATLHQAAFQATPVLARALAESDNAPKNKISNIK
jgi:hypothetical protein